MSALEEIAAGMAPATQSTLRLVRRMNGSTQSLLVADTERRLWVLKLQSHPQAPHASANEVVGSHLCRALGLPVPDWAVMQVDSAFCGDRRTWRRTPEGLDPVQAGPHFASRYVPDALQKECFELIPPTLQTMIQSTDVCLGMFLFDVWSMHADSRQALFTLEDDQLVPIFFDHGHLFGGPDGKTCKPVVDGRLLQQIALRSAQEDGSLDVWIERMQSTLPAALDLALADLPAAWAPDSFLELRPVLLSRLRSLRTLTELALAALEFRMEEIREDESFHLGTDVRILSHGGVERWA